MESFYELSYMESSVQLLNLREEIKKLQTEKEQIEQNIRLKQKQEAELSVKNLRWLRIVNQKMGAEKYSPKKRGIHPPTPKKCTPLSMGSSTQSSTLILGSAPPLPPTVTQLISEPGVLASASAQDTMAPASASASSVISDSSECANNGERTIEEAKTVLDNYKVDKNGCEIRDSVTDDELLSLEGALHCIESVDGNCKENKKVNEGPEVAMCSNVDGNAKVQNESNVSAYEKHSGNISDDIRNDQYVMYESGNGKDDPKCSDGKLISGKNVGKMGSGNGKNKSEYGKNGSKSAKAVIPKTELPENKKASNNKNGQK